MLTKLSRNPDGFSRWLIFFYGLCLIWQVAYSGGRVDGHPIQSDVGKDWTLLIYVADKVESLDVLTGSLNPIVMANAGAKPPSPGMACFSPDAGKITFKEATGRGEDSLVVFDLRERKRQVLLDMPFLDGPRWSPDGGTIAFSGRSSNSGAYNLYSYGLDNKKLATLVQDSLKDGEMVFSWAPDGKHIVYQSSANAIYDFSFARGESSKNDDGWFPTWSPSGEYIAYRADGLGDPGYVIYDLKTRAKQRILQGVSVYRSLIWSPDSRMLIYAADGRGEFYGDLFILDLKTNKSTRVLRLEQSVYPTDWRRRENP
jgi:Tol biopolymer transport system component